ncbi:MAG: 3-dehydroquinate synthase [Desulfotignum sp.]|nr:3-dehydroquinate synthase [Desulfotignum sp.]
MIKSHHIIGQQGSSVIHVGARLADIAEYLPDQPLVIITDKNIKAHYARCFPEAPVICIGTGEAVKTLTTVEFILKQLMELGCDRSVFILGIGGGIVCDITGFVASIFMRGVDFGFVSTSLLSQVDASVGGKNGVNVSAFKNMAGVFNQPRFVVCDPTMLHTLPASEVSNGLAEIVKHALIADAGMLTFIEKNRCKALALDPEIIFHLVSNSVAIKARVVQEDEKESGNRRKLNFGHTLGHAIEKLDPSGHGRAVSRGMVAAARFSSVKGLLSDHDTDRIIDLLQGLGLPTDLNFDAKKICAAVRQDKKKQGQGVFFVFLTAIGAASVEKTHFNEINVFVQSCFVP